MLKKERSVQQQGHLKLGLITVDESNIHADASKGHVVSWDYLSKFQHRLEAEMIELLAQGRTGGWG